MAAANNLPTTANIDISETVVDDEEYFLHKTFCNIQELSKLIHQRAVSKGFWEEERNVGELIALIHSELSEALEAYRDGDKPDDKLPNHRGLTVELADALIRILDMAGGMNLDIAGAIVDKLNYNKSRAYKHGKNF